MLTGGIPENCLRRLMLARLGMLIAILKSSFSLLFRAVSSSAYAFFNGPFLLDIKQNLKFVIVS